MLATLAHWQRQLTPDGVAFAPPPDLKAGTLRVREKMAPLRPLRAVVDEALAAAAAWFSGAAVGPLERLTTGEGESAGLVTVSGRVDGGPAERTIAMIAGDDGFTLVDAIARDPARFAEFREQARAVVAGFALGLGALRWRRFLYQPPAGWQGRGRGLAAEWYPLDFPSHRALIAVLPGGPPPGLPPGVAARPPHPPYAGMY